MDYRLLFYFTTLIDQGTFTKAAKYLHISQPSLSSAIKKLEESIGLVLIERSTRNFQLTKEGEIVYKESKKLIQHFNYVEKEIFRLKDSGPLELQIGLIESVKFWLPDVLNTYNQSNPDVRIKLAEVLGLSKVEESLKNYKIHLAITNQRFKSEEIRSIPIYTENLVALVPSDHPLTEKESITFQDIKNDQFIICKEGFQTRDDILKEFLELGISPNIKFEIERFETAYSLVEAGIGITIVPENYIRSFRIDPKKIKQFTDNHLARTVYIAILKSRYLPPVVEEFIDITKEFFIEKEEAEQ